LTTSDVGTGGVSVTVTVAVPERPSLVAVIVADPGATAVTSPVADTVATAVPELDHVTARPSRGTPLADCGVAVSCAVPPSVIDSVAGVTATLATGTGATATVAVPERPSLVAVIVADPGATAVTSPVLDTVATVVPELDHVTVRPSRAAPLADCGVAVSCAIPPTKICAVAGVTTTLATGTGVTVTGAVAVFPSAIA
jgi:hypothetical protein